MGYWLLNNELTPDDLPQPVGSTHIEDNDPVIDQLNAPYYESLRVAAIKEEAKLRIIKLIPGADINNYLLKENNIQARVTYLLRRELKTIIAPTETIELDEAEALWLTIADVRAISDAAEVNGDSLLTFQAALDLKGY